MVDSTVPCPSCGKQYRIREGSKPGTFVCTACGAEVTHGAPGKARPAQARPAGARPGPSRKSRAATGAPKGGLKRTRAASERPRRREREGAPPPKTNTGLYIGLGALVLVILVVIAFVAMNTDTDPVTPIASNQGSGTSGDEAEGMIDPNRVPTRPAALIPDPEPESTTEPEAEPEPKREKLDTGKRSVDNKETDPYKMQRMQLRSKTYRFFIDHLKHLDDTPQDLRDEIDKLCATLVDFSAGADGPLARSRLAEIGKPAVPRVLLAFSKAGDLSTREGMINACFVDGTLHEICGNAAKTDPLLPFTTHSKGEITKTGLYWCAWWFSTGHKVESFAADEDEEEEEE